jgi:hypothetical protein
MDIASTKNRILPWRIGVPLLRNQMECENAMAKAKKKTFSVTKAVKANSRERLGMPKSSFPLPTVKEKAAAKPKHKETLADLLTKDDSA